MWNKIRNWIRNSILTENEIIISESTVDISVFRDYRDNQDKRQTYLLEKLKEFEETQNAKYKISKDKLTSIQLSLSNMMVLMEKQDAHLRDKKELRFLDDMNYKMRNRNDFKNQYEDRLAANEKQKLRAKNKLPIVEPQEEVGTKILSKEEWNKLRKGDKREYLGELSDEDKITQINKINPFMGGSNSRRGREWAEEYIEKIGTITESWNSSTSV